MCAVVSPSRFLTTLPPRYRWHTSRLWTNLVHRRSFRMLGPDTVIVRPLVLRGVERISIGARCAVYERCWLQTEESTGSSIEIGDDTYLGHDVHVHSIDAVTIGSRCMLADGVLISSGDHLAADRHDVTAGGPIHIGDDVFIGQRAMVLGGVSIGDGATVGAGAVVTRDVPAGSTAVGVPARVLPSRR